MSYPNTNTSVTKNKSVFTFVLFIIGIFIVCALIFGVLLGWVISHTTHDIITSGNAILSENSTSPILDNLVKRVDDSVTFIQILISLIGVMAVFVGGALGLLIWQTSKYSKRILNEAILDLKSSKLDPIISSAHSELEAIRKKAFILNIDSAGLILDDVIQTTQETYKMVLENKGVEKTDIAIKLEKRLKLLSESREVSKYLIGALSQDETVVQEVCLKLLELVNSEVVKNRVSSILDLMKHLLDTWPQGITRTHISLVIREYEKIDKK